MRIEQEVWEEQQNAKRQNVVTQSPAQLRFEVSSCSDIPLIKNALNKQNKRW